MSAYVMRISDWSSDVCSSDLHADIDQLLSEGARSGEILLEDINADLMAQSQGGNFRHRWDGLSVRLADDLRQGKAVPRKRIARSEEHTSELQSLMRISYAVFCLKKKK